MQRVPTVKPLARVELAEGEDSSVRAVAGERTLQGTVNAGGPSSAEHAADVRNRLLPALMRTGIRVEPPFARPLLPAPPEGMKDGGPDRDQPVTS